MSNSQQPIDQIRIRNVRAAIWSNTTKEGRTFYSVTVSRSYRDADGNWKDTTSFSPTELLTLAKVADMAHSRIVDLISNSSDADDEVAA